MCGDEQVASELAVASGKQVVRYGLGRTNVWRELDLAVNAVGGTDFGVYHANQGVGKVSLQVPGKHNVLDALAAIATGERAGVSFAAMRTTLQNFRGVARRFQVRGTFNGATIIDHYAHHPTEIAVSIAAAHERYPNARLVAVFQPHTFTRTQALLDEFAAALDKADRVLVTEIFAAREQNPLGV